MSFPVSGKFRLYCPSLLCWARGLWKSQLRYALVGWMLLGLGQYVIADDEETSQATSSTREQLEQWIDELDDASYATRENAAYNLSSYPKEVVPLILDRLSPAETTVDAKAPAAESALRMLRLLASWAKDPEDSPGRESLLGLERLARGTSTVTAIRAQNLLTSITLEHSVEVTNRLRNNGVFIGPETVQIITKPAFDRYLMRIDGNYHGSVEDLDSLRWLVDIDMVHARGNLITSEVLKKIVRLPNLKVLQIRETKLRPEDIELIANLRELEVLEFIYTELDPAALDSLADLPVSRSLRLFGTGLDPAALDELGSKLEGIEFVHGRGGFLGIMSEDPNSNVVGNVVEGSGAALADLRSQDRILLINKTPIMRFEDLRSELSKYAAGDKVLVEFERPQQHIDDTGRRYVIWQPITAEVTLGMQD